MDKLHFYGTKEGDALATLLGPEALATLRLALRLAACHDKIGNAHGFAALYHQLGGSAAEVTSLLVAAS